MALSIIQSEDLQTQASCALHHCTEAEILEGQATQETVCIG